MDAYFRLVCASLLTLANILSLVTLTPTDSDVNAMVNKLDLNNVFASSNLDADESENCMKNIKSSLRKFQETEALIEKLRNKKPFIRNTKLTDRLGKDSRLFFTLKETISSVSSGWSSPSKGQEMINHFSQDFQNMTEKGGGLSSTDKETAVSVECDTVNIEYRRIDGKCNNIANKHQGSAGIALKRFLHNSYADGISEPRGAASLPSARIVSTNLHHGDNPNPITTKGYTHMVMQFGQFLDHDITMTPELGLDCCDIAILTKNPDMCFNIEITGDLFYSGKTNCHSFTRSDGMVTSSGAKEQMNGITAFVDASNVYGSEHDLAQKLRTFVDGKMKTHEDGPMLPTRKQCGLEVKPPMHLEDDLVAGDERAIEQPTLASIHSLFLNEHNRIAEELKSKLSPYLSNRLSSDKDELLYQESRKIVGAEMQNIVYNEFLPIVLGQTEFKNNHLELGTVTQYNATVDPSVSNEFATVAFRFGHSLIAGIFFGNGGHQLRNHYFDVEPIFVSGKKPNNNNGRAWYSELEEESKQKCPADDMFITQDVTNFLFSDTRGAPSHFGEDLPARNIQRGRDHGIPSYNDFRSFCGLSSLTGFENKPAEISDKNWLKIQKVYINVDDIDAFTGGLAENTPEDGLVGPIFACIIGKQFKNLKYGDRFFFNNEPGKNDNARGLMPNSRETVRRRTLRDIMCDNTEICQLQKFVMKEKDSLTNPQQDCSSRNILDFDGITSDIISNDMALSTKGTIDTIYFIAGGYGAPRDIELYHPTMDNLSCSMSPPSLNNEWYHPMIFYYNNNIHLCGGWKTASTCISYSSNTEEWKTHTLSTSRRYGSSSVILDKRVFIIGGKDTSNNYVSAQSTPLPLTDQPVLTPIPNLDYKGLGQCTTKVDEDTLVVTGGWYGDYLSSVIEYNAKTRTTTSLPSMIQPRYQHGCAVVEMDNTKYIIVAGGQIGGSGRLETTEMLQMGGDSWKPLGNLNVARRGHSIAVTQRGVMAIGGYDGSTGHSSVELLDWSTKSWTIVQPSLSIGRSFFGGAVEIPASMFDC